VIFVSAAVVLNILSVENVSVCVAVVTLLTVEFVWLSTVESLLLFDITKTSVAAEESGDSSAKFVNTSF